MGGIGSTDEAQVQPSNSQRQGSSRAVREVLGEWMVDAVDWADNNRRSLLWGSLLGICSGTALLLKLHGLPGYSRITTQAQLADRLLRHQQRSLSLSPTHMRLPVLLTGAQVQGGRLAVSVLHYPLLLRWADWYRGAHPSKYLPQHQRKQHGAGLHCSSAVGSCAGPGARQHDGVLTCNIAGTQDVHASVGPLLQQHLADTWRSGSGWPKVQQLRVFAVTAATAGRPADAGQAAATPAAAVAAGGGTNSAVKQSVADRQGAFGTTGVGAGSSSSSGSNSSGSNGSEEQHVITHSKGSNITGQQPQEELVQEVWAELWVKGLPTAACKAAARQVASQLSSSTPPGLDKSSPPQRTSAGRVEANPSPHAASTQASAAAATADSGVRVPLQQQAAGSWLPQRQKDVAELLLRHGLAHLAEPEDCDWLGIRQARWKAYQRAALRARQDRVGLYAASVQLSLGVLRRVWTRIAAVWTSRG